MGVPRLRKYIADRYGKHIVKAQKNQHAKIVDNLYIDGNAYIHPAAQLVFNYGSHDNKELGIYSDLSFEEKSVKTLEIFFEMLCEIFNTTTPTKRLYIAIDGVAPVGKMCQQRARRFSSRPTESFDSNAISVGTMFEWNMTIFLQYAIQRQISIDARWQGIEVILSPPTVAGEGEHKIIQYIKNSGLENESHCLASPDGDLIMLIMSLHFPKFTLYQNDLMEDGRVILTDMSAVHNDLCEDLSGKPYSPENNGMVDDFILLGFFVGNDFLPKIGMFEMLEYGLDAMVGIYKELYEAIPNFHLTANGSIHSENFHAFIGKIANIENDYLNKVARTRYREKKFINRTLQSHIEIVRVGEQCIRVLDCEGYISDFYTTKLKDADIEEVCRQYIRHFDWVFKYYTKGCPSYREFYPYHYPPFMQTLNSMWRDEWVSNTFDNAPPLSPFEQLLCVLPKRCTHLLPAHCQKIINSGEIDEFYPDKFEVDYEGKYADYQGIVKLPFVDVEKVQKIYTKYDTEKKFMRNTPGRIFIYRYDAQTIRRIKTPFGNLKVNVAVE